MELQVELRLLGQQLLQQGDEPGVPRGHHRDTGREADMAEHPWPCRCRKVPPGKECRPHLEATVRARKPILPWSVQKECRPVTLRF